jgi:hypothetical protein
MYARLALAVVVVLAAAGPAAASDETLADVGAASRISAFGGWVVFNVREPGGTYTLHSWHDGVVAPVGVPAGPEGFDVDVGPDAEGRPTAVYSRCQWPRRQTRRLRPEPRRGCSLFAVTLGGGQERRLSVAGPGTSEFAPAIWGDMLAFGRRRPGQRRADILLARPGRPLQRLGAGSRPSCRNEPCRRQPSMGWPVVMDLGPQAVAYNWQLSGGDTFLGEGTELRIARLDGSRARIAQAGWSDGECGATITRSPNVSGLSVRYGYTIGACGGGHTFRRFDLAGTRRLQALPPAGVEPVSLAWDGDTLYWIRQTGYLDCGGAGTTCELVRSRGIAFARIQGGEAVPPIEVYVES